MLPAISTAEQLTLVTPIANCCPEAGLHVTVADPSQLSVALILKATIAEHEPLSVLEAMSAIASNVGASLSACQKCQDIDVISCPFLKIYQIPLHEIDGK